jgi:copper chaperone CopZ
MEWVIRVEGMTCPHCETAVKRIAEEVKGIKVVQVSHEQNVLKMECETAERVKEVVQKINQSGIYKAEMA